MTRFCRLAIERSNCLRQDPLSTTCGRARYRFGSGLLQVVAHPNHPFRAKNFSPTVVMFDNGHSAEENCGCRQGAHANPESNVEMRDCCRHDSDGRRRDGRVHEDNAAARLIIGARWTIGKCRSNHLHRRQADNLCHWAHTAKASRALSRIPWSSLPYTQRRLTSSWSPQSDQTWQRNGHVQKRSELRLYPCDGDGARGQPAGYIHKGRAKR